MEGEKVALEKIKKIFKGQYSHSNLNRKKCGSRYQKLEQAKNGLPREILLRDDLARALILDF